MFWCKNKKSQELSDIKSVVILEYTQIYKNQQKWGMNFGSGGFSDCGVILMDGSQIPAGAIITFSITYKNGHKGIIKAKSGTNKCDKLLQMALDPITEEEVACNDDKTYKPITIKKNQLPAGNYIIGKDIPKGVYDFTWVFGYEVYKRTRYHSWWKYIFPTYG